MNIERRKGQVEVGQRRKNHRETFTVYEIEGDRATVCQTVQVDPVNGYVHKGGRASVRTALAPPTASARFMSRLESQ